MRQSPSIASGIRGFYSYVSRKPDTKLTLAKGLAMGLEFKLGRKSNLLILLNVLPALVYDCPHMIVRQRVKNRLPLPPALYQFTLLQNPKLMGNRRLRMDLRSEIHLQYLGAVRGYTELESV